MKRRHTIIWTDVDKDVQRLSHQAKLSLPMRTDYIWAMCSDNLERNDHSKAGPHLGLSSLSGKTSYRKTSWSIEAARCGFRLSQLLWNLTATSAAAVLPRCLSNLRAIRSLLLPISWLRDFKKFGSETFWCHGSRDLIYLKLGIITLAVKIHEVCLMLAVITK